MEDVDPLVLSERDGAVRVCRGDAELLRLSASGNGFECLTRNAWPLSWRGVRGGERARTGIELGSPGSFSLGELRVDAATARLSPAGMAVAAALTRFAPGARISLAWEPELGEWKGSVEHPDVLGREGEASEVLWWWFDVRVTAPGRRLFVTARGMLGETVCEAQVRLPSGAGLDEAIRRARDEGLARFEDHLLDELQRLDERYREVELAPRLDGWREVPAGTEWASAAAGASGARGSVYGESGYLASGGPPGGGYVGAAAGRALAAGPSGYLPNETWGGYLAGPGGERGRSGNTPHGAAASADVATEVLARALDAAETMARDMLRAHALWRAVTRLRSAGGG